MSFLGDIGTFINRTVGTQGGLLSDIGVEPFKVPAWGEDVLGGAAALGGALALPALLPELGGALGVGGAGADAAAGGFDLGTIGSGVDATGAGLGSAFATTPTDLTALGGSSALGFSGDVGTGIDTTGLPSIITSGSAGASTGLDLGSTAAYNTATGASSLGGDLATTVGNASNIAQGAGGNVGFLNSLTNAISPSNAGAAIGKAISNPLTDIGIAGLGYNLYSGYQQKQALNALNATEQGNATAEAKTAATENAAAAPLLANGQTLMTYLTTNTLPPQFQASVDQQVAAAKAQITQGYASRGMSPDPNKNSALAQDLNNVDQQALTLKAGLETQLQTAGNQMVTTANQLLSAGISATQLSAELPIQMAQLNASLNQQMASSISSFAAALNGGGKAITLNLGGANTAGTTGTTNLG